MKDATRRCDDPSERRRATAGPGEGGYALAVSLLAIVVVTLLAAAGYNLSSFELDTSRDFDAETEAFYVADQGMNRYLATDSDDLEPEVTYQFDAGTATVTSEILTMGMENNEELYRVTSVGEHETPGGETVRRTVSTVLLATPLLPIHPNGTFATNGKFQLNGNAATISGSDQWGGSGDSLCEAAGVQSNTVPGVVADTFQTSGGSGDRCEDSNNINPDPECRDDPVDEFMTADQWRTIRDSTEADQVITQDGVAPTTDGWELVRATGDFTSEGGGDGQGILVVEGDFTSDGSLTWEGLILVGGRYVSNGTEGIEGGLITGLNSLLGEDVGATTIGNGGKDFLFNSCSIYKASRSKYRVSQVPSSWYEDL